MMDTTHIFQTLQKHHPKVAQSDAEARKNKIRKLHAEVLRRRQDIRDALKADMNEPESETDVVEIYRVTSEAKHAVRHLSRLMRPQRVPTPLSLMGAKSYVQYEPKGVCLIISPWNFPFDLTLNPLIAAVAAGNSVLVKPSEISVHSSRLLRAIIESVFDANEVAVVEGDAIVATELLKLPFNHIYFTGAPSIGKIVMRAAAEHLTSVTLELGGKSPVIVDETADIDKAAFRILGSKFVKCGQMCITPDYVLVHASQKEAFVKALKKHIAAMCGADDAARIAGAHSRMINDRHFARVKAYLDDATAKGATIECGGTADAAQRYIEPTVLSGVTDDMTVMQEEIFGPLLPVSTFNALEEATAYINKGHKPLSLYIFSKSTKNQQFILKNTSAGGVTINSTGLHALSNDLPFGGVNNSGIGKGHGAYGFKEFSNAKAVLKVTTPFIGADLLYLPYGKWSKRLIDFTIKWM
jgi:aldehyde dehydrogenase (NAD+)